MSQRHTPIQDPEGILREARAKARLEKKKAQDSLSQQVLAVGSGDKLYNIQSKSSAASTSAEEVIQQKQTPQSQEAGSPRQICLRPAISKFGQGIVSTQAFVSQQEMSENPTSLIEQEMDRMNDRMNRLEGLLERIVLQTSRESTSVPQGPVESTPRPLEEHVNQRFERVESILLTVAQNQTRALAQGVPSPTVNPLGQQDTTSRALSIRASEVPAIDGSSRSPATVIGWLGRLELLFNGRDLVVDEEQIKVAGMGITDLEWGEWYRINHHNLQKLSWMDFEGEVKKKFLLADWEFNVLSEIRALRMGSSEEFERFAD